MIPTPTNLTPIAQQQFITWQDQVDSLANSAPSDDQLIKELERIATGGNHHAAFLLGHLYQGGCVLLGQRQTQIQENPVKAFYWVNAYHVANPNDVLGMRELGELYCKGYGTPVDVGNGLKILMRALHLSVEKELFPDDSPGGAATLDQVGIIAGLVSIQDHLEAFFPASQGTTAAPIPASADVKVEM